VHWSSLPAKYRIELLTALEATLPSLNNRELSNIFWALGKTNISYTTDLSASFRELLMDSLSASSTDVKLFDLESIFVGLGLMQVQQSSLVYLDTLVLFQISAIELTSLHLLSLLFICLKTD
jgi:hypothetical protein